MNELEDAANGLKNAISLCGPQAVASAKELVEAVAGKPPGDDVCVEKDVQLFFSVNNPFHRVTSHASS